jgi:A nuclease family of the HNH/ENDO VII superfamily with conserved AHH
MSGISVPEEFQLHHLLPVGVFGHSLFKEAFQTLLLDGFDPRYFHRNGLLLPSTESAASQCRLPMHRGPHRQYNELVADRVSTIIKEVQRYEFTFSARADAIARLDLLIGALRTMLGKSRKPPLLNSRDPANSPVEFSHIENACDALWQVTK